MRHIQGLGMRNLGAPNINEVAQEGSVLGHATEVDNADRFLVRPTKERALLQDLLTKDLVIGYGPAEALQIRSVLAWLLKP